MPQISDPFVPESFLYNGLNTAVLGVASNQTSFPRGTPLVFDSTNQVAAPATLNANSKVSSSVQLYGFANEPFDASLYARGSTPIQQKTVNVTILLPGVPFVANWHTNTGFGAQLVGTNVALKFDTTLGKYVIAPYASGDAAFRVVGLYDAPGTPYGRLVVVPDQANRLFK